MTAKAATKKVAARIPLPLLDRLEKSRARVTEQRGAKPTFTSWVTEAIAEKLNREEKMLKK